MQRRVPSAPDYTGDYVISTYRPGPAGTVLIEVVTDSLQRLHLSMRQEQTSAENIDATIRHALAALARPPDPVR